MRKPDFEMFDATAKTELLHEMFDELQSCRLMMMADAKYHGPDPKGYSSHPYDCHVKNIAAITEKVISGSMNEMG